MPKAPTPKSSFINPASLSFPSPPPEDMSSPSPEPQPGPSRKRARTEQSSEERKEARAHRNRIAAQNSRDRRKAQFSHLERRVAELEEENRQLRAGMGLVLPVAPSSSSVLMPSAPVAKSPSDEARERENEELKQRIRTLEKGWDAVVKALAAQGLPTGLAPSSHTDSAPSSSSSSLPAATTPAPAPPTPSPSTTFSSIASATGGDHARNPPSHVPAAGGLALFDPYGDLPTTISSSIDTTSGIQDAPPVDDATMESLFREIISERESSPVPQAHSELPSLPTESLPTLGHPQPQDPLSQAAAAHTASASETQVTSGTLEEDRRMSVSGVSLGGSTGLSAASVSGNTGSSDADGLGLGLSYETLESDMMDLSEYIGDSATSSESGAWSDIGLTLEGLLDILPSAQDATVGAQTNGLWESLEGRVAYV